MEKEQKSSFHIYKSSAGSGKTHTLVREYLALALRDPAQSYKHILAITFTNKAMQEMKNRIINTLSAFSKGEPHAMTGELMEILQIPEIEFQKRSSILLDKILHEYSYFSISTIDAFFQRIIRSFTKELGLYGQFQLELDTEMVKIRAIDELIDNLQDDNDLTKWIVRFAEEKAEEGKSWNIKNALKDLSDEIFKESFVNLEENLPDAKKVKKLQQQLIGEIKAYEETLKKKAAAAIHVYENGSFGPEDFNNNTNPIKYCYAILNGRLEPSDSQTMGGEEIRKWIKKSDLDNTALVNFVENELMPLFSEIISFHKSAKIKYNSAKVALNYIYGLGLLTNIANHIHGFKQDNDILFISDATKFITKLIQDSSSPFIFEKVGSFFQNYLIDEFQDTSAMQWNCLQPLIFDTISAENKSIVVGDTKQSIYRWRGGDWTLLEETIVQDLLPQPSSIHQLNSNFRSDGNIVQFNNDLFTNLPSSLFQECIDDDEPTAETKALVEKVKSVYEEVGQETHESKINKGYIRIQFLHNDKDDDWQADAISEVKRQIDDALERGYNLSDIALLVRKGKEATLLAQVLLNEENTDKTTKYAVITEEALLIKNSSVVMTIISALKFLQNRRDHVALAEIINNYQETHGNVETEYHQIVDENRNPRKDILPFDIEAERVRLLQLPMEEVVERLIRLFDLPGPSGEEAYLQTFQDMVLEFGRSQGNDIDSFMEWWEEKGIKRSINVPSGVDAIHIMTIHKAKGLQFPIVIIPFADWEVNSKSYTILWGSSEENPYNNIPLPLRYVKQMGSSVFHNYYYQEKIQSALDSLNMLYVAFTRPVNELYAFAPNKNGRIAKFLLKEIEKEGTTFNMFYNPQEQIFQAGEKLIIEEKRSNTEDQVALSNYQSFEWRDRLVVKKIGSGELNEQARRGTHMHSLLSKISYMDDLAELSYFKDFPDKELLQELMKVISHKDIKPFFQREYEVLNEYSILYKGLTYRPDRIVTKSDEAVVIDYKWGAPKSIYIDQIRNYASLLTQMGYEKTSAYLYYVDHQKVEKVA